MARQPGDTRETFFPARLLRRPVASHSFRFSTYPIAEETNPAAILSFPPRPRAGSGYRKTINAKTELRGISNRVQLVARHSRAVASRTKKKSFISYDRATYGLSRSFLRNFLSTS